MEDLRKRAENARYYFYSFSGGRDSAFAMYLTVDKFRNMGKEIAAIFVDNGEDYVLIRGGKANQKRPESGTKLFQVVKNKPQMVIYNPLYEYDTSVIDEKTADFLTWDGYKKGFVRTACWCCPFQKPQQWVAMREHYPVLHERLKRMFMTYTFVLHPNDGHIRYIADYWIKKEFIPVKFEYAPKRKEMMIKCVKKDEG